MVNEYPLVIELFYKDCLDCLSEHQKYNYSKIYAKEIYRVADNPLDDMGGKAKYVFHENGNMYPFARTKYNFLFKEDFFLSKL